MIRAGGEIQAGDGLFEQVFAGGVEFAELVDFLDTQLAIGFAPGGCFAAERLFLRDFVSFCFSHRLFAGALVHFAVLPGLRSGCRYDPLAGRKFFRDSVQSDQGCNGICRSDGPNSHTGQGFIAAISWKRAGNSA